MNKNAPIGVPEYPVSKPAANTDETIRSSAVDSEEKILPNAATLKAMSDLKRKKNIKAFDNADELFKDLEA